MAHRNFIFKSVYDTCTLKSFLSKVFKTAMLPGVGFRTPIAYIYTLQIGGKPGGGIEVSSTVQYMYLCIVNGYGQG
jgi:hypothetical protein